MVPGHKKLKQRHNSRIDCNHLPLIEIPSAKTVDNFEVAISFSLAFWRQT